MQNDKVLAQILQWYRGKEQYLLVDGQAGSGKTYLVGVLLGILNRYNIQVGVTAPTNEAVSQLALNLRKQGLCIPCSTIYKTLGFGFDTTKETKILSQIRKVDLDDLQLLIVDEASMIPKIVHEAINTIGVKCLYLGHKNQLPEIEDNSSARSYIYTLNIPTINLTTQYRHTGSIFDYCIQLNDIIDTNGYAYKLPRNFDIPMSTLLQGIKENKGKLFLEDIQKILCWTNNKVDDANNWFRHTVFGSGSTSRFLPSERILLRNSTTNLGKIKNRFDKTSFSIGELIPTNTKGRIVNVNYKVILDILTYELEVDTELGKLYFYVPENTEEHLLLLKKYLKIAHGLKTPSKREKAFANYHTICSLFADVSYSYAITIHRAQGMTIPEVFLLLDNVNQCQNRLLRLKLHYVGASRAQDKLNIIR
ncbi:MAG: AAA family ATPase [Burkholderiales bacterium]